ncbi:MAG: DUF885 domain-containing protein, partial [Actinomycetota bacterium]|nr:DUF885 domain-containing protein [Actinomycetota bacterium]
MTSLPPRLRAVCDLSVPTVRENAGLHGYDGVVQDLTVDGVRRAVARLGGDPLEDPHDEAHLAAAEGGLRVAYGELELHRRDPLLHLENLDLAAYDREYAPEGERAEARRRHLTAWPDAVDMAVTTLDAVPAPVAEALAPAVAGLAAAIPPGDDAHLV